MDSIKKDLKARGLTDSTLDNRIGDYDEVSKMLGHSVNQTTQIYTQCRKLNLVQAINKCDGLVIRV